MLPLSSCDGIFCSVGPIGEPCVLDFESHIELQPMIFMHKDVWYFSKFNDRHGKGNKGRAGQRDCGDG